MASLTSLLTVRLLDQVSGPARKAQGAIRSLQGTVSRAGTATTMATRAGDAAMLASTRLLGAAGGVAGIALGVRSAITSFAELERQMNRVGVTAGASVGEVKMATSDISRIANDVGVPLEQVVGGLDALVAAGRSLPEAMSFLPAVVQTAQAAGAETSDIAASADAMATSFKIAGSEMQGAFDILVAGGNAGKFELKDMARYLPSIAASAAAVGLKGTKGLKKTVAMLQTIREQTGSSEEAATSMVNIFAKMESEETAKRFKKFGVDLRKEMALARIEGKDLVGVFVDLAETATKGDLSKIPQLFSDMEFARGMRALLSNRAALKGYLATLDQSAGAVGNALKRVSNDTQAELDRLSNKWSEFAREIGSMAAGPGIGLMQSLQEEIRTAKNELSDFSDWVKSKTGFSLSEIADIAAKQLGVSSPEEIKAANDRREAERRNPDLVVQREAWEEWRKVNESIARQEAVMAKRGKPIDPDRATTAELTMLNALKDAYTQREMLRLRFNAFDRPWPTEPAEITGGGERRPADADDRMQAREEAIQREAAPVPIPNPLRAPAVTVPAAPLDDSTTLTKILGELSALTKAAFQASPGSANPASGTGSGGVGSDFAVGVRQQVDMARTAVESLSSATGSPTIDSRSIDDAIAKVERLKSAIENVNSSTVSPRIRSPDLGQSLRGIHADTGIE